MELSRRQWIKSAGAAGIVGLAGCTGGTDGSGGDGDTPTPTTVGQADEAQYVARLATPWGRTHMEFVAANVAGEFSGGRGWKGNIENESNGRIRCEVFWSGQLGVGTEIARNVQQGSAQIGHLSLSNLSPFAPAVDLVNLPYITGVHTNMFEVEQKWVDLHTSDKWKELVDSNVEENGFIPVYWNQGPRELWTTDTVGAILTPEDMRGVKHRTPPSKLLNKMWSMVDASPSTIAWGETPQAMQEGVASSMHVGIYSLIFGFQEVIDHITTVNAVSDATAYIVSKEWYDGLPSDLQDAMDRAMRKTKKEQLAYQPESLKNVRERVMKPNDIQFHELNQEQVQAWADEISYEKSDWDPEKEEFAGSIDAVDDLVQSMNNNDSEFQIPSSSYWGYNP